MICAIPRSVVEAAQRSDLADSAAGAEMHVALGQPDGSIVRGAVSYVRIQAPPEAWEALVEWCERHSTHDVGADSDTKTLSRRCSKAADDVADMLDRLARHPAYRGIAVAGRVRDRLPARRTEGDERWWPTRRMALANSTGESLKIEATVLIPEVRRDAGRLFTTWRPAVPR